MNDLPTGITAQQVIQGLCHRFPEIHLPDNFYTFLERQEKSRHRLVRQQSSEALYDFFKDQALVNPQLNNYLPAFLTPDSRLAQKIDYAALRQLDADTIFTFLVDQLAHVLDLQQVALDSEHSTGFNSHGCEHVSNVTRNALTLLRQRNPIHSVFSTEKEVVIGGLLHDIGNLLQRQFHGLYGVYLITQLFYNYAGDAETFDSFLTVLEVVIFHEIEFGTQQALFDRLNPATLSVIIADKTDVSFRRVSAKSNVMEAMRDAHVLVNLLVANSKVSREAGKAIHFRWTVDFQAKYVGSHQDLFSRLLKVTGRVKYPEEWIALYEESNIEYLFVFQSTFLRIYLSRLYFTVRAVFTLYPSVNEFQLVVEDAERGISLKRIFTRNEFRQQLASLGRLFYREAWQGTAMYKALEQA